MLLGGLISRVAMAEGLKVVGSASTAEGTLEWLQKHPVDLIVIDDKVPDQEYHQFLKAAQRLCPHVKLLLMGQEKDPLEVEKLLAQGLSGYMLRQDAHDRLVAAIYAIGQGERYLSPQLQSR
ncbi:Response regulator receiver domain-containing protein [Catalinimonas alkaloidigena]|uniref:Response regulator receiver domain-containing protein n=2 Tax=Catalinimonas alkaloidigena TaxID=1075417 RepID=A0A1G9EEP2_9BACT|nr:Response regulator receiver domain-containing protein [Catalinimonas alkaloidigena]